MGEGHGQEEEGLLGKFCGVRRWESSSSEEGGLASEDLSGEEKGGVMLCEGSQAANGRVTTFSLQTLRTSLNGSSVAPAPRSGLYIGPSTEDPHPLYVSPGALDCTLLYL